MNRTVPTLALVAGTLLVPAVAQSQLAVQRSTETVLVLPPVPKNPADSAFAVQVGDALRKKLDAKLRLKLRIVPKDKMAEALGSSGFPADAILDDNGAGQLARFINVDAYVTGQVERNSSAPRLSLRLVDNRRSGLSGWINVKGTPGQSIDDFVNQVADSVDQEVKAAEQARECLDRRDRQEYGSARERAERAFRIYPNHPSTALCVASVFEAMKSPPDSQIAMLKKAVQGDSMLSKAWESLARQYQAKGDSANWAEALLKTVEIDPTDMRKRLAAAYLLFQIKQYPRSVALIDEGLQRSPGDLQSVQLRDRVCFDGQLWGCAVEALGARFEADSAVQGDSLYLKKLLAATQATNDTTTVKNWAQLPPAQKRYYRAAPDSLAMEKWTAVGVRKFPNSVSFWRARASALKAVGKNDEAEAAFRKVAELDPTDFASRFQAAQILVNGLVIDSTKPLDLARLESADTLLTQAAALADSNTKINVAVQYFTPATKLVQNRMRPDLAITMLEKTIALDPKKQLYTQANFFLGLAYVYNLPSLNLEAVQKNKDCKALPVLEEFLAKAKAAMTAGASVQQATANQVLQSLSKLDAFPVQARKAWNCK